MKYMLITIIERDMTYEFFNTLKEAQEQMQREVNNSCNDIEEYIADQMADINTMAAWVTDGNNHDDYDWYIVKIN